MGSRARGSGGVLIFIVEEEQEEQQCVVLVASSTRSTVIRRRRRHHSREGVRQSKRNGTHMAVIVVLEEGLIMPPCSLSRSYILGSSTPSAPLSSAQSKINLEVKLI